MIDAAHWQVILFGAGIGWAIAVPTCIICDRINPPGLMAHDWRPCVWIPAVAAIIVCAVGFVVNVLCNLPEMMP